MNKSDSITYKTNPEVACREVKGQLLFLTPDDRRLYTTNDAGRFLWRQLVRKTAVDKIIAQFQKEFGLTEAVASKDARKFLAELEKRQIISRTSKL